MRFLYLLLLTVILVPIVVFAYQNSGVVNVRFFDQNVNLALSVVIIGVYLLGMVSGSSLVGLVRRTIQHLTEGQQSPAAPPAPTAAPSR